MKGIRICGDCANYSYKKHKCLLGYNKETDPRSEFYDDCPLPDAVEVKHGYWDDSLDGITPYCSVCGHSHGCIKRTPNYCPNCGAKMQED